MPFIEQPPSHPVVYVRPRQRSLPVSTVTADLPDAPLVSRGRFRIVPRPDSTKAPFEEALETTDPCPGTDQLITAKETRLKRQQANRDENGDYIVGKGRPPANGQIKLGEVRNKRGPKKGEVDFIKAVNLKLAKKLPIKLGGKKVSMSTVDLVAHNIRALVIEKNLGAIKLVAEWTIMGEELRRGDFTPLVSASQMSVINQLLSDAGYDANPVVRKRPGETDFPDETP